MASSGLLHEKHLVSLAVGYITDARCDQLLRPHSVLQMHVVNLRKRPLSNSSIDSMEKLILSLYHNLVTGNKTFPCVPVETIFRSDQFRTPFENVRRGENDSPAGLMVPPAGSDSPPKVLMPRLPEKADLCVLKTDSRNCVRTLHVNGILVTRVISPLYNTDEIEMTKRWRVTDYSAEGNILMSVLCHFLKSSASHAKREAAEEESSSRSPTPPRKRMRL